jgi:hypothetical protein
VSRISIIIPTFNRATLLCEAIRGLDTQVECVIVDDASSDDTMNRVTAVQSEWPEGRIVFLRQETHQGAQAARNHGIERATGEFLLFLDSDDVPRPEGILKLYDHLESNPNVDYCFGRVQKTDPLLNSLGDHELIGSPFGDGSLAIAGYHWHTMGALYRRSCIERVGPWNPELTGCQDWEYQARVKMFGGKGEFVDTLVGYWRQHDGERVGTACFRPDYVQSVMLACESILAHSRACGRRSAALERRIAKKLVVHALEWGANGYLAERRACFAQAVASLGGMGSFSAIIRAWSKVPAWGDESLWKLLTKP